MTKPMVQSFANALATLAGSLSFALAVLYSTPGLAQLGSPESPKPSNRVNVVDKVNHDDEEVLQRLHPFYFAYGKREIKMQISFKTPMVRTWPLYLGYTQLMFYEFDADQKAFRDLTYNPQLFYTYRLQQWGPLKSIDLGIFDHNSNGKPGADHRSYNASYVKFNFELQSARWLSRLSLQLQDLYAFQTTNTDIQNYIGPLALNLSFVQLFSGWIDKSEISLITRPGGKFGDHWDYGGHQLSWSFRLGGIHLVPAFYLQYYTGYAESLLNYNRRINDFRAGLIF